MYHDPWSIVDSAGHSICSYQTGKKELRASKCWRSQSCQHPVTLWKASRCQRPQNAQHQNWSWKAFCQNFVGSSVGQLRKVNCQTSCWRTSQQQTTPRRLATNLCSRPLTQNWASERSLSQVVKPQLVLAEVSLCTAMKKKHVFPQAVHAIKVIRPLIATCNLSLKRIVLSILPRVFDPIQKSSLFQDSWQQPLQDILRHCVARRCSNLSGSQLGFAHIFSKQADALQSQGLFHCQPSAQLGDVEACSPSWSSNSRGLIDLPLPEVCSLRHAQQRI